MMRASLNFCSERERHTHLSLICHGTGDECKLYLARLSITNLCFSSICMTTQALQSLLCTIQFLASVLRHNSYTPCFSLWQIKLLSSTAPRWTYLHQNEQDGFTSIWKERRETLTRRCSVQMKMSLQMLLSFSLSAGCNSLHFFCVVTIQCSYFCGPKSFLFIWETVSSKEEGNKHLFILANK